MNYRISPIWWPALAAASPVLAPWLAAQGLKFRAGARQAKAANDERLRQAGRLDLPALASLEIAPIVEQRHAEGFVGDAGVAYRLRTERGAMLLDVGFGPDHPAFAANASRWGFARDAWDALFITHLHPDHLGGLSAVRRKTVRLPEKYWPRAPMPCFAPAPCEAPSFDVQVVDAPRVLPIGLATTGPLARMLSFAGIVEEQAVVARLQGKGLAIVTGCGHPTIELILRMARRLSDEPIYAVAGGLHFPISASRVAPLGIQFQQIIGVGKPWWSRIEDRDLDATIAALNAAGVQRLLLSAHDSCDHALDRLAAEVRAKVEVLTAGVNYAL